jgi:hypothetical protein
MNFESPGRQLNSHNFKCECPPSAVPYACLSAYKWLHIGSSSKFEYKKNRSLYKDLTGVADELDELASGSKN